MSRSPDEAPRRDDARCGYPAAPTARFARQLMTAKRDAPDMIEAMLAKDPMLRTDAADPMLPTLSTEPTDPMDRNEFADPMLRAELRER
jgi:hypothetical protein